LSRNAKNKSIEKVKNFIQQSNSYFEKNVNSFDKEWKGFDLIMTKNNISRKECLLLPLNTALDALNKKSL
jgi:nitrogen fixation NifU-like protein